ncbi:MAG: glycosyltransferase family 4 protein [Candidatus Omnitrophica bacterium]|nr:glycosyltransferase family 4 protein [Candidatus Omnitrophota bacterium]
MKWAVLVPRFLPEKVGGNITYVYGFSEHLSRYGHDVHVFTTTRDKNLAGYEEGPSGVKIHRIFVRRGNAGALRFATRAKVTEKFLEIDKKIRFDILNTHSCFLIKCGRVRPDLRFIHTLHAVVTYEYLYSLKKIVTGRLLCPENLKELLLAPLKSAVCFVLEAITLRKAEKIIVMSNYVKGTVLSFFPFINEEKILVSRIGVDLSNFRPVSDKRSIRKSLRLNPEGIIFFTVRRLTPRMGLENLVKAFAICREGNKDANLYLYIAGKGILDKRLAGLIKKSGLHDQVSLLGFVPDENLYKYFQAADVFVLPSEELEGFGIVSIEALASGIPVIATPVGANKEIAGSFCPELVTSGTGARDIAEKMGYFIKKKERYGSVDYSERIKDRFSWTNITDEINKEIFPTLP